MAIALARARALDLDLQMIRRRSVGLSIKPFTAAAEAQRPTSKNIDKVFFSLSLRLIAETLLVGKIGKTNFLDRLSPLLLIIIIILSSFIIHWPLLAHITLVVVNNVPTGLG